MGDKVNSLHPHCEFNSDNASNREGQNNGIVIPQVILACINSLTLVMRDNKKWCLLSFRVLVKASCVKASIGRPWPIAIIKVELCEGCVR